MNKNVSKISGQNVAPNSSVDKEPRNGRTIYDLAHEYLTLKKTLWLIFGVLLISALYNSVSYYLAEPGTPVEFKFYIGQTKYFKKRSSDNTGSNAVDTINQLGKGKEKLEFEVAQLKRENENWERKSETQSKKYFEAKDSIRDLKSKYSELFNLWNNAPPMSVKRYRTTMPMSLCIEKSNQTLNQIGATNIESRKDGTVYGFRGINNIMFTCLDSSAYLSISGRSLDELVVNKNKIEAIFEK